MLLRRLCILFASIALPLALPSQASAHHLIVSPPGHDEPVHALGDQWVGGSTLPESVAGAPGLFFSPVLGWLPASHGQGLVQACLALREHGNGVVSIAPPPLGPADADCQHGPP